MLFSERPPIYASSCMTISGERTEQLDIFCRVTGFMSDFLSFIDVELIRFFHGAIHLFIIYADNIVWQCGYCDHFVAVYVNVYVGVCVGMSAQ